MDVEVARTPAAIDVAEWWDLAGDVAERNVFYEPFVLLPAWEHLGWGVRLHLFRDGGRLVGLAPVRWGSVWRHRYCFLCTPLVRRGYEDAVVGAMRTGWFPVHGNGALARAVAGLPGVRVTERERPFLDGPPHIPPEVRRKRRRLAEQGELVVEAGEAVEAFLALEHAGWKGRAGTSMQARPRDASFLRAVARAGVGDHRLECLTLTLDGRPIASTLQLRSGPGVFTFKLAYDESLRAYSPGVQVAAEVLERLAADPTTDWVDSCMGAPSELDSLWPSRRVVHDAVVGPVLGAVDAAWRLLRDVARRFRGR